MKKATGRGRLLALLSLGVGLLLTIVVTWGYLRISERMDRDRFERDVEAAQLLLSNRLDFYISLLRGAAGLFTADENVSRERFYIFTQRLRLAQLYPGTLGIGFSKCVPAAEKDRFLADMRAQGRPDFAIRPAGERADYHVITYLEPEDRRNQVALGYDMFTDPVRRAAMEQACDIGGVAASGKVTLVQEIDPDKQAGFLIYTPVYRGGTIPPEVAERRAALMGFAYLPFRANDFFATIFADKSYATLRLEIFDGSEISPAALLHGGTRATATPASSEPPRFAANRALEVAGHPWMLRFTSRPEFDQASASWFAPFFLIVGALVSLLLAGIAWAEAGARAAAERNADLFRHERERFRTTLTSIGDAVIVADEAGHVTFMNSMAERLTGWPQAEAARRPLDAIVQLVHEGSRQAVESPVARVLREKRVIGPDAPALLIARDGAERPLDHSAAPIRDEDGDITGAVLVFHDVSERRLAEEALQIGRERMEIVLEAAAVGLWFCTPPFDCLVLDKRARAHLHLADEEDEVTVEAFYEHLHPEDRARTRAAMLRAIEDRQLYDIEYRTLAADNGVTWVRAIGRAFYNEAGRPVRFSGVTIDMTDRKGQEVERERLLTSERATRAEAERANRIKDEFLATLSHELRTPLNSILGWTQLLQRSPLLAGDVRQGLESIEHSGRMQAQLVGDLLDMSRIISGKVRLDVRQIDLSAVIEAALESLRPAAEAKDIRLRKVLDSSVTDIINGDAQRLQQIFWNLLSNAIKFTPRGGRVEVLVERVNSQVEISVSDTGQGIKGEFLPYVFDRFRQADSSTTRKHGGLGLGLAIVKHLTELHGGTVRVKSEGEGQGAVFFVLLPLAPLRAANEEGPRLHPTAMAAPAPRDAPRLAGVKILIVDDDPDACALVRRLLEEAQAEVATALSVVDALRVFSHIRPQVLVSDIGMPDQDGYELIRRVRVLPVESGGATPAVALTAFARAEDRIRALEAGYQMHVSKPVEPIELLTVIASLVSRSVGASQAGTR